MDKDCGCMRIFLELKILKNMGYKEISLKLPPDYTEAQLTRRIGKVLNIRAFSCRIDSKSLDARKKDNIHWLIRVAVSSEELEGTPPAVIPLLEILYQKRKEKVLVVGNGPAGFFAAYVLQKAGFKTALIDRGAEAPKREAGIKRFERTGVFDPVGNYAFGEGGAGTFSDGKLTSRSKHISQERRFILESYIQAGAPEEIAYMAHPHIGSDHLKIIVQRLREQYQKIGGKVYFETLLEDLKVEKDSVVEAVTSAGSLDADMLIIAPGHSSFETYRMLSRRGVSFRTKNFAIGSRVEHRQEVINLAQWGQEESAGCQGSRIPAYIQLQRKSSGVYLLHVSGRNRGAGNSLQPQQYREWNEPLFEKRKICQCSLCGSGAS